MAGKNIIAGLVIAGLLIAGGATVILTGDEVVGDVDGGTNEVNEIQDLESTPVYEHEVADRVIVSSGGKRIRVVKHNQKGTRVQDTELGRVVIEEETTLEDICNVVFEARVRIVDRVETPRFPLEHAHLNDIWLGAMTPLVVPGSKIGDMVAWWTILRGENCRLIADYPGYWGSTMRELLSLPVVKKSRILRTAGVCNGEPCVVPVGNPGAIDGEKIYFPMSLAGREDINFVKAKRDVPEDRREVPDGGYADAGEVRVIR
uniref:Uncharacterized protein n=1 Tax=viral metagenome TaxID=1070528 RepID=A0A6M3XNU1_9ZZZZ